MKLQIVSKSKPTDDAISLYFNKTGPLEHYKAGQHALLSFRIDGRVFKRTYSFHTSPHEQGKVGITVRSVEGGFISNYLQSVIGIPEIFLDGLAGEFTVEPRADSKRHLVMFAAGSGITPLMSMLKTIMHCEPQSVVSLIYANKTFSRIIFKEELSTLEKTFPDRLKIYHILSQDENPPADFPILYKGRASKLIIKKLLKTILAELPIQVEYYLCGPLSFIQLIEDTIYATMPVDPKIYKEHFYIPEAKEAFDLGSLSDREVIIEIEGEERLLIVPRGKSILESALSSGIKLRHSCTEGQCGTCRAQLITGEVKLRKNHILSEDELRSGQILLCQGFPASDGITIKASL